MRIGKLFVYRPTGYFGLALGFGDADGCDDKWALLIGTIVIAWER